MGSDDRSDAFKQQPRNRLDVGLIGAVVVCVVVGTVVSSYFAILANRQKERTTQKRAEALQEKERADEKVAEAQREKQRADEESQTAVQEKGRATVNWLWDTRQAAKSAPAGTRYFRKTFIGKPHSSAGPKVVEGMLDVAADDQFRVWWNGTEIGAGNDPRRVYAFDVAKYIVMGTNVIAIEATNQGGPAGVLSRLGYVPSNSNRLLLGSDGSWKVSDTAEASWQQPDFDDSGWQAATVLGGYGTVGPWRKLVWDQGGDDRFSVPRGFRVESVATNPDPDEPFSLINMCFDAQGRLFVSQEGSRYDGKMSKSGGTVLVCTDADKDGLFEDVRPYCDQVKNCHGLCWVGDALLLVGAGPQGTGLYRVKDTDGDDRTDQVQILHKFPLVRVRDYGTYGGMNEHGPHAIIHGPDDWLYMVVGNHAWAKPDSLASNSPLRRWPDGQMGPDQGRIDTTEDVLLPRMNESHAANILAPGGTIWRLDHDGKQMSMVSAGYRNAFDAAFNSAGELFSFDSDMDGDFDLPWYREVRVCHATPGSDFLWRTGSANTPNYYIDSLPPTVETGPGSPTGVEVYEHHAFPKKYHGALFLGDWTLGVIYAVHLQQEGASAKATVERFCTGVPMNVTDLVVGPDGALYFTLGGRLTQGGVYRIVYDPQPPPLETNPGSGPTTSPLEDILSQPQPLSAWGRKQLEEKLSAAGDKIGAQLADAAMETARPVPERVRAMTIVQRRGVNVPLLQELCRDTSPLVRAHAVLLLGQTGRQAESARQEFVTALKDPNALVRRRACEAILRSEVEPPIGEILSLLGDADKHVRTAARVVIQRVPVQEWSERILQEPENQIAMEAIVGLCRTNQANSLAAPILERLVDVSPDSTGQWLDYLRTLQLVLIHTEDRPSGWQSIGDRIDGIFPHDNWNVTRELAIVLTHLRATGIIDSPIETKLLGMLDEETNVERSVQYHYFLRFLKDRLTPTQKGDYLAWYEQTQTWSGGAYFRFFRDDIFRQIAESYSMQDRVRAVQSVANHPWATAELLRRSPAALLPNANVLLNAYNRVHETMPQRLRLKGSLVDSLGRSRSHDRQSALREIAKLDPDQRTRVATSLAQFPNAENWPLLVEGLAGANSVEAFRLVSALSKIDRKPAKEDAEAFRRVIAASGQLDPANRWSVVRLLRRWNPRQFGSEEGDWEPELNSWSIWFRQTFPTAKPLPVLEKSKPSGSIHKLDELLAVVEKSVVGSQQQITRGRAVFEKAQCAKCHRFGKIGVAVGADLDNLAKRFKRRDMLEAILSPSKVISDQYRSSTIITKDGAVINGLALPLGDTISVVQQDGKRVEIKRSEIEQQVASLISVMPAGLLNNVKPQSIADLIAFLESIPPQ